MAYSVKQQRARIKEQMEKLKARDKLLRSKDLAKSRKARNHTLILYGAEIETLLKPTKLDKSYVPAWRDFLAAHKKEIVAILGGVDTQDKKQAEDASAPSEHQTYDDDDDVNGWDKISNDFAAPAMCD